MRFKHKWKRKETIIVKLKAFTLGKITVYDW